MKSIFKKELSTIMSTSEIKKISNACSLKKLMFCIFGVLLLLVLRDIVGLDINKFFFIIPFAMAVYLLDFGEILYFFAFMIPVASGLPKNYIFLLLLFALIYKRHFAFNVFQISIPFLVFLAELLHLINFNDINVIDIGGYIAVITIISIIVFEQKAKIENDKILLFFALGSCSLILIILTSTLEIMSLKDALITGYRFGNVRNLMGDEVGLVLGNNANNIAYYAIIAISSILVLMQNQKTSILTGLSMIFILVFGGLLTLSRSFVITLILLLFMYLMILAKPCGKNIITLILGLLISLFLYNIIYWLFPDLIQNIMFRFQETSITGDRDIIFEQYTSFMMRNPIDFLLGVGLFPMLTITGMKFAPHNAIQQVWVAYGFVGLSFFVYVICNMIIRAKDGKTIKLFFYLPLIVLIIFTQTIQFLAPFELMLPLIIGISSIRMGTTDMEI
jgi:hypothetical protein